MHFARGLKGGLVTLAISICFCRHLSLILFSRFLRLWWITHMPWPILTAMLVQGIYGKVRIVRGTTTRRLSYLANWALLPKLEQVWLTAMHCPDP